MMKMDFKTMVLAAILIIELIVGTGIISARLAYNNGYDNGYQDADSRVNWSHWGANSEYTWVEVITK